MNIAKKISKKIEQVRQEPEHVRIHWVWGSVFVSMLVIVAIWIFSLGSLFQGDKKSSVQTTDAQTPDINKQLQDLKQQAPSLKDFSDQALTIGDEGISPNTKNPKPARSTTPTTTNDQEIPPTKAYSDLMDSVNGQ